jgi:ATP-binding cassette, subfamily C, bacterial CydD
MGDFSATTDSIAEMASVPEGGSRVPFAKRIRTKVDGPESLQHRLLSFSRSARIFLYLTVASGFIVVAIAVVQALLISDVVSQVFTEDQTLSDVKSILWIMLAFAVLRAAIVWGGDLTAQRSASHLKGCLRDALTKHLFALGPAYTRGERSGELVNTTVRGVEDLDEYMSLFLPLRFLAVLVPIFIALVVSIIDPLTVIILLVTGPVLVLLLALIGGRAKEVTERRFVELGWMSAFFLDMLQGLATLKMFGRSREQVDNVRGISRNYGSATMRVLRTAFETALVLEWSTTIATALVAVEVSLRLMRGALPFNQALALLIITPEFFFPLRQLALRYHAGAAGKAASERIFAILDTPLPQPHWETVYTPTLRLSQIDIQFEHVNCSYDNGQRPALHDFSLNILDGRRIALTGETGAGKTTVANLLLRFVEADAGSILVNGTPLNAIDPVQWRSHIAWVPQHAHLFYGTIADNIRIANPEATDDKVVSVATAAHAHDFIADLPQGYNTPIGENGARLSGGERQRLAIARAFLKDAPLLILDEATSHLDSENEAMVLDALDRLSLGRTVLIIAHRMNLVRDADHVVVMHQGRVVEAGTSHVLSAHETEVHHLVAVHDEAAV